MDSVAVVCRPDPRQHVLVRHCAKRHTLGPSHLYGSHVSWEASGKCILGGEAWGMWLCARAHRRRLPSTQPTPGRRPAPGRTPGASRWWQQVNRVPATSGEGADLQHSAASVENQDAHPPIPLMAHVAVDNDEKAGMREEGPLKGGHDCVAGTGNLADALMVPTRVPRHTVMAVSGLVGYHVEIVGRSLHLGSRGHALRRFRAPAVKVGLHRHRLVRLLARLLEAAELLVARRCGDNHAELLE
eukprot:3781822-Prymnesium_polylepis.1